MWKHETISSLNALVLFYPVCVYISVQPRDIIFVKGYGFLSFAKNMRKKIGKNISKNLSSKYIPGRLAVRQKLLDHAKQSETDAFKTAWKKAIQKTSRGNWW